MEDTARSRTWRERVRPVRRHVGPDFEHDLGVACQRHVPGTSAPAPPVDEHRHARARGCRERGEPPTRQGLAPRTEQVGQHWVRPRAYEHEPSRVERNEPAVAAGARDPPGRDAPRRSRADSGGDEHHAVGGEHLDVDADTRAEPPVARADHGAGRRRLKPRASPDWTRLRHERGRWRGRVGGRRGGVRPSGRPTGRREQQCRERRGSGPAKPHRPDGYRRGRKPESL